MSQNTSIAARLSPYRALLVGLAVLVEIAALSQLRPGVHGGWLEGVLVGIGVMVTILLLLARSWVFALLALLAVVIRIPVSDAWCGLG